MMPNVSYQSLLAVLLLAGCSTAVSPQDKAKREDAGKEKAPKLDYAAHVAALLRLETLRILF